MSTRDANIIICVNNACLIFGKVQFLLKISHLFVNRPVCQVVHTVPLPCPALASNGWDEALNRRMPC
jgi:hypothetical protein